MSDTKTTRKAHLGTLARLRRTRRVMMLGARIYLGYRWIGLQRRLRKRNDADAAERRHHRKSAERIFHLATKHEGLLIKAAQIMGSRPDVLPDEYVDVLSRLQDQVPAKPFDLIRPQVEEELGRPLSEVFSEFEPQALAAASKGQVHRARLKDGRDVAVKVLYPGIERVIETDLRALKNVSRIANRLERSINFNPIWDELSRTVPLELDMINEGRNAEAIARNFEGRDEVLVPKIIWEYTTPRMLVMQYMEGVKINDVEALRGAGIDLQQVAHRVSELYCEQIYVQGMFHADPHPGNLLVQPGPRIVFLDFGLCREMPDAQRRKYCDLTYAIVTRDRPRIQEGFRDLGFRADGDDAELFATMGEMFRSVRAEGRGYFSRDRAVEAGAELRQQMRKAPLREFPGEFVFIMRVMGLLSGIGRALDSRTDTLALFRQYAEQGLNSHSTATAPQATPPATAAGE